MKNFVAFGLILRLKLLPKPSGFGPIDVPCKSISPRNLYNNIPKRCARKLHNVWFTNYLQCTESEHKPWNYSIWQTMDKRTNWNSMLVYCNSCDQTANITILCVLRSLEFLYNYSLLKSGILQNDNKKFKAIKCGRDFSIRPSPKFWHMCVLFMLLCLFTYNINGQQYVVRSWWYVVQKVSRFYEHKYPKI